MVSKRILTPTVAVIFLVWKPAELCAKVLNYLVHRKKKYLFQ